MNRVERIRLMYDCGSKKEFDYCYIHDEKYITINSYRVNGRCSRDVYMDNIRFCACKIKFMNPDIEYDNLVDTIKFTVEKNNKHIPYPTVSPKDSAEVVDSIWDVDHKFLPSNETDESPFYTRKFVEWKRNARDSFKLTGDERSTYHKLLVSDTEVIANNYRDKLIGIKMGKYASVCRGKTVSSKNEETVKNILHAMKDLGESLNEDNILSFINYGSPKKMSLKTLRKAIDGLSIINKLDFIIKNKNDMRYEDTNAKLMKGGHTIHDRQEIINKLRLNKEAKVSRPTIDNHWRSLEPVFTELNNKLNAAS